MYKSSPQSNSSSPVPGNNCFLLLLVKVWHKSSLLIPGSTTPRAFTRQEVSNKSCYQVALLGNVGIWVVELDPHKKIKNLQPLPLQCRLSCLKTVYCDTPPPQLYKRATLNYRSGPLMSKTCEFFFITAIGTLQEEKANYCTWNLTGKNLQELEKHRSESKKQVIDETVIYQHTNRWLVEDCIRFLVLVNHFLSSDFGPVC